jgi:hydroxyethylthiazole kinase-like uncharacterized protein yjeF
MERAGLVAARLALALAPHARRVHIWCGPGNNGVMALHLCDPALLPTDAAAAWREASAAGVPMTRFAPGATPDTPADLVIDALLGIGARRAPDGDLAAAIGQINRRSGLALAVDLPSGLHPQTGQCLGDAAVRADACLSLLTLKPGLFTGVGRDHAGDVWFDDLGARAAGLEAPAPVAWRAGAAGATTPPPHAAHKGSRGDVVIVGGAPGMVGAAWLAARAALAAGSGRSYVCLLDPGAATLDAGRPELMSRPAAWLERNAGVLREATVVCGCGGGTAVRPLLPAVLTQCPRVVLDADALNALAAELALMTLLRGRAVRGQRTVLTPHPLEAARLLHATSRSVQADRLQAAAELAQQCQAVVVLKGSGSVIAAPGSVPVINPSGNAALASAGTGDVLAGWLGGRWATQPGADAAALAQRAVWEHGDAADRHRAAGGTGPLRAADLVEAMHRAY